VARPSLAARMRLTSEGASGAGFAVRTDNNHIHASHASVSAIECRPVDAIHDQFVVYAQSQIPFGLFGVVAYLVSTCSDR
jgi:hypothetical protein